MYLLCVYTYHQIIESVSLFQSEIVFRRAVWEKNLQLVIRHNQEASAGKHSFTMGLNHLADMVRNKLVVFSFQTRQSQLSLESLTFKLIYVNKKCTGLYQILMSLHYVTDD